MPAKLLSALLVLSAVVFTPASPWQSPSKPDTPRVDPYGDPLPPGVLARCGSSRLRHGEEPDVMLFTPDKKMVITGSKGQHRGGVARLLVWEVATGKLLHKLTMKRGRVMTAALSADGLQLECACGEDEQVEYYRWVLATGRETRRQLLKLPSDSLPVAVALQKEGVMWVAVGSMVRMGKCEVLGVDLATGAPRSRFLIKEDGPFWREMAFSSDGQWLAISSGERSLRIYSLATGRVERTLQQAPKQAMQADRWVTARLCRFSPDGRWLVRADRIMLRGGKEEQELELWEVSTGKRHLHLNRESSYAFYAIFTPDNQHLLFHQAGKCHMHHLASGKTAQPFSLRDDHTQIMLSTDGQLLAASTYTGILSFWDMASGKKLPINTEPEIYLPFLADIPIRQGRICLDGPGDLAWDPTTGKRVPWVHQEEQQSWIDPPKDTLDVRRLKDGRRQRFSSNGQWVAFQDRSDAHAYVWNLKTGREALKVRLDLGDAMDLSSNGRWLAVAPLDPPMETDRTKVHLWNVVTGTLMHTLKGHEKQVRCLVFSPDGRMLATGSDDTSLRLWEAATGQLRYVFTGHETALQALGFTSDSRLLAAASFDAPIFIWEVHGHQVQSLTAAEMEQAWLNLSSSDASLAFKAIQRLAVTPKLAVPFLQTRLQPAPIVKAERVQQLLTRLASPQFTEREKATSELQPIADQVLPQLRQALRGQLSPEARRRLEEIVKQAEAASPELLRSLRAMEVLEWIGTPEVLPILDRLAGGAAEATLTQEAKASTKRLRTMQRSK